MSDVEFVQHSIHKYKNHSSIQHINKHITNFQHPKSFTFQEVSIDTVKKVLEKSNPKKATGYDQILPRILKEDAEQLAVPIAYLFNESVLQCKVGPQHKKDDMLKKENYRPVSILTSLLKTFEKIIDNQMETLK